MTGTVVVEASPLVEDNRWLLDLARDHPVIVGVVGRLLPGDADFGKHLARFSRDPKFRGIRITHDEIKAVIAAPAQRDRLKALGDASLTLDVNGGPAVLADAARLAEMLPELRIVVNHLGNTLIDGKPPSREWVAGLTAAAKCDNVWCKLSALVDSTRLRGKKAPADPEFYRPVFDAAWAAFGAKRLLFGSNWPVSDHYAGYPFLFDLAIGFVKPHGQAAVENVFGRNAVAAYRLPM